MDCKIDYQTADPFVIEDDISQNVDIIMMNDDVDTNEPIDPEVLHICSVQPEQSFYTENNISYDHLLKNARKELTHSQYLQYVEDGNMRKQAQQSFANSETNDLQQQLSQFTKEEAQAVDQMLSTIKALDAQVNVLKSRLDEMDTVTRNARRLVRMINEASTHNASDE